MKASTVLFSLAAIAVANPLPQSIDAAAVNNAPIPSPKSAPWGAGSEVVPYDSKAVADATYNNFLASLKSSSSSSKRSLQVRTQAAPCGALPVGYGPSPDTDTAAAFLSYPAFASAANNAVTPDGYVNVFTDLNASSSLPMGYLGFDTLQSYDVQGCATKCNFASGCIAFNIFFERDPTILPADSCPNPASTTLIKCTYWGAPVGPDTATNYGQFANDFQIVQTGSNGYNAQNVGNVPGYSGDFLDSAAINAPNECNTFITSKLFNDGKPFDPVRCAAACQAETDYNAQYLNSQAVCRFFNTYILSKNGVPQGQYCSLYTASWDDSYATNTGYVSGSDVFTVSYSYSYSNTTDPRLNDCTCGVGSTCNTGVATTSTSSSSTAVSSSSVATVSTNTVPITTTTSSPTTSSTAIPTIVSTTAPSTISTTTPATTIPSSSTISSTPPATTIPSSSTITTISIVPTTTSASTTPLASSTTTSTAISSTTKSTTLSTTSTSPTTSAPSTTTTTSSKTTQSSTMVSTTTTTSTASTSRASSSTTTSTSCTTTSTKASTTTTSTTGSTTKAGSTSTTLTTTTTKTTSTASATPTPKGPCFKVKIKGPSYCNNAYIGLDSTGVLSYSATNAATFYLDDSAIIRTKDGKFGKCPNAKTSDKNGSIQFGANSDPAAVTCSGSGSSVSCTVAGQSVTSLWTSSGLGTVVLGNKPSSGKWDQVSVNAEKCSCSA